jgi:hypothetical protein
MKRTEQIGKLTGARVHVLHVARGHIVPEDITGGTPQVAPDTILRWHRRLARRPLVRGAVEGGRAVASCVGWAR